MKYWNIVFKMYFLISFLFLITSFTAFAYKNGDNVHADILEKLSIEDNNKLIIVEFFASWCYSCKIELPLLVSLYKEIDKSRVDIIGVDIDKDLEVGKAYQKDLNLNFKVVNDNKFELVSKFNPPGMPALYYIKNGKIIKIRIGAIDHIDKIIIKDIKEIQNEKLL